MRILARRLNHLVQVLKLPSYLSFGPFNSFTQRRWMKPVDSAQTRLENRTRDLKLDNLTCHLNTLAHVFQINALMCNSRRYPGTFVSVQAMSKWKNIIGINVEISQFIRKYPHIFQLFTHPVSRTLCCRITKTMRDLIEEEENITKELELQNVILIKKLLMMSMNSTLHIHSLRLIRRELGLPVDFRDSILAKYTKDFKLIDLELVELIDKDNQKLGFTAEIEKWREKEYTEKWLSEFETKYAFPINLPTGFKIQKGFKLQSKNWQRLQYSKPYEEKKDKILRIRTCGGLERFEKRSVGILHELLSLTVEKMVAVERLAHFKKDFGMGINVRELLLKHPGIFYISTKGDSQLLFLREAYSKGCLIESNPVYDVRRKMMDLLLLGCRSTRELQDTCLVYNEKEIGIGTKEGDWVFPILKSCRDTLDEN